MAQPEDDEPALLLAKYGKEDVGLVLLNEKGVLPKLATDKEENRAESKAWYMDNGAGNHMTGQKSKFKELDECIIGQLKIGDGFVVNIEGKGSIVFKCKNGEECTISHAPFDVL